MSLAQRIRTRFMRTDSRHDAVQTLSLRRVFIIPSANGWLYGAVLVVMYLGAVNYNLGLGHGLVFLLASLGLTGMVHGFRNLAGLQVRPGRAEPVFAGQPARFSIRLTNDSGEFRSALVVRHHRRDKIAPFNLPARGTLAADVTVPTTRRGMLTLPPVILSSTYPLGLFYVWSRPQPPMRCLVYPRPELRPLPEPSPGSAPAMDGSQFGDEDFAGLRPRQPGDSPKHVAWKSFARDPDHRPLLVKQFAAGTASELWLDASKLGSIDLEMKLSILTGWVLSAERAGTRYGIRLGGTSIDPGIGKAHREACLECLARFGIRDGDD